MAIADKWTRLQLRGAIRREIMDGSNGTDTGRWWTNAELNLYLDSWQNRIQSQHELVWGSATATITGSSTLTLTNLATDVLRVGHLYYNNDKMVERSKNDMEMLQHAWRGFGTTTEPKVIFQPTFDTVTLWPPLASTAVGTVVLEYPRQLSFADDSTVHELPAWTKYSAVDYGAFRCYLRRGSNEDPHKAQRYKQIFQHQVTSYGTRFRNYFPKRGRTLRPGGNYEAHILDPFLNIAITIPELTAVAINFEDEVPSGLVNSSNVTYTLSQNPDPDDSLQLYLDGLRMVQGTDYTISGVTITMTNAPATGQTIFAHFRWVS